MELRIARQDRVFSRDDGFELYYLLDESVIRRAVGGTDIMKRQVRHLLETCQQDNNVTIRIVPFRVGLYRSIRVPFVVLEFSEPEDEAILYLEYPQGDSLIREDGPIDDAATSPNLAAPTTPPTYLEIFSELVQHTSEEETVQIFENVLQGFGS